MIVHKLNLRDEIVVSYEGALAEHVAGGVRLVAYWTRPPLALGYTTFETGDRFVEWFYSDRWYNIFEIHGHDDRLKGWYCNIAAPARIEGGVIACRDLLLDLWVAPDGQMLVLDEDEFAAETALDPQTRAAALAALAILRAMVQRGESPFDALAPSPTL